MFKKLLAMALNYSPLSPRYLMLYNIESIGLQIKVGMIAISPSLNKEYLEIHIMLLCIAFQYFQKKPTIRNKD